MGVGMLRRYHTQAPGHANEPGDVEAAKEAQDVTETPAGDGQDQAEPPAGNASTEEWRAYAVEVHGADPEQVAGMKRDELRDQYGPKAE